MDKKKYIQELRNGNSMLIQFWKWLEKINRRKKKNERRNTNKNNE